MSAIERMTRNIKSRLVNRRNLSALTQAGAAGFGVTATEVQHAAHQRTDVLERLARMAEFHETAGALASAGRYELLEMARKCDRCPHERKCARILYAALRPCAKEVDFCPNAAEYPALAVERHTTDAT
ncbi:hypothetical protein [Ensifer sp. ENS06]|uniref:hypothetical protein n=1 Tax=Ensifer sp. ENS06 TaxID=2769276 RepID=UPI001786CAAA|nr:hypothetical protein [Ensifer sp. ENS06]